MLPLSLQYQRLHSEGILVAFITQTQASFHEKQISVGR